MRLALVWLALHASSLHAQQLRFTGWRDPLADRKKNLYEKGTQMLTVQQTRELAVRAIARHLRANPGFAAEVGNDLYEFGVYTGGGLRKWLQMLAHEGIAFTGHVWGFDSFEGMPAEDMRFKSKLRQRDKGWLAGGLNTAEQLGIADWTQLCRTIIRNIGHSAPERIHMLRGFYNESLRGGRRLAHRLQMKPALIVDFDCDLYTSSEQAMRFTLDAGVLVPGSYVYLDDIMPWVWRDTTQPSTEQKLAFEQLTSEYGLTWHELKHNATRREHAYQRPVLRLTACQRCKPRRRDNSAAERVTPSRMAVSTPDCVVPRASFGETETAA